MPTIMRKLSNSGDRIPGLGLRNRLCSSYTRDLFSTLKKYAADIDVVLSTLIFSEIPARIIIRNTSEYKSFLENLPANALPSEIEQMRRGDIPFYFKFTDNKKLFWKKVMTSAEEESDFANFGRDIERHASNFSNSWCQQRTADIALAQGCLFLIKHFGIKLDRKLTKDFKISGQAINIGGRDYYF